MMAGLFSDYEDVLEAAWKEGLLPESGAAVRKDCDQDGRKLYTVRGSSFLVDNHYEVISAIGHGAYGVVCAAVDLRLVSDSAHFCPSLIENEEGGLNYLRVTDAAGHDQCLKAEPLSKVAASSDTTVRVAGLQLQPFQRRILCGRRSPLVAIKKVSRVFADLVDARRVVRETKMLKYLQGHPNIVHILDLMLPSDEKDTDEFCDAFNDVYVVTELMDTNLHAYLRSGSGLSDDQLRYIAYQIVKALIYTHSSGVVHRDLKPGNVLLNSDCSVRVCDFGISRGGVPAGVPSPAANFAGADELERFAFSASALTAPDGCDYLDDNRQDSRAPFYSLTDYVVTRYYRAPEVLVMGRYNHAIDIWSLGCILGEMVLRKPLFPGTNYLSQLALIAETPGLLGMPRTEQECSALFEGGEEGKHLLWNFLAPTTSKTAKEETLRSALFGSAHLPTGFMGLLTRLLAFDPRQRPTAIEVLRDPFFADLYCSSDEIVRCTDTATLAATFRPVPPWERGEQPHNVLVEDACDTGSFPWAFDHRVVDIRTLQCLFCAEARTYRERKRLLRREQSASAPNSNSQRHRSPREP